MIGNLSEAVYTGVFVWVLYLALEPYYRRFWPAQLISWVRLLDGRLRDPLVGRDLLFGAIAGVVLALVGDFYHLVPRWLNLPLVSCVGFNNPDGEMIFLRGLRFAVSMIAVSFWWVVQFIMIGITFLLLLRMLLRRSWPALALWMLLGVILFNPGIGPPLRDMTTLVILWAIGLFVLVRFGVLCLMASHLFLALLGAVPLTWDFSRWYAGGTIAVLATVVGLVVYALSISLAGRPLFGGEAESPRSA